MKIKYIHGRYYLENKKKKDFYIYDTKRKQGRAFVGGEVKELTFKSAPRTVRAILDRGARIVGAAIEPWEAE